MDEHVRPRRGQLDPLERGGVEERLPGEPGLVLPAGLAVALLGTEHGRPRGVFEELGLLPGPRRAQVHEEVHEDGGEAKSRDDLKVEHGHSAMNLMVMLPDANPPAPAADTLTLMPFAVPAVTAIAFSLSSP